MLVPFAVLAIGLAFGFGGKLDRHLHPRERRLGGQPHAAGRPGGRRRRHAALALIASIAADVGASDVAFFPFMTLMMVLITHMLPRPLPARKPSRNHP